MPGIFAAVHLLANLMQEAFHTGSFIFMRFINALVNVARGEEFTGQEFDNQIGIRSGFKTVNPRPDQVGSMRPTT